MTDLEWHRLTRTPTPTVAHGFTAEAVQLLCAANVDGVPKIIEALARHNDVASLQHFMAAPIAQKLADLSPGERSQMAYAVCHMLVDHSPNREWAGSWLDHFEQTDARKSFKPEVAAADRLSLLLSILADRPGAVDLQRLLGLLELSSDPFEPVPGREVSSPPIDKLLYLLKDLPTTIEAYDLQGRVLGEALHARSPERLPDVVEVIPNIRLEARGGHQVTGEQVRTPLAQAMWSGMKGLDAFLPVVIKTYGTSHAHVRRQMNEGFAAALAASSFDLAGHQFPRGQFEAIASGWVDLDTLSGMWDAKYEFSKIKNGKMETQKDVTFAGALQHLALSNPGQACLAVAVLSDRGVELDRRVVELDGAKRVERCLLDVAVEARCPQLFAELLSHGLDPDRAGWTEEVVKLDKKRDFFDRRTATASPADQVHLLVQSVPEGHHTRANVMVMKDVLNA